MKAVLLTDCRLLTLSSVQEQVGTKRVRNGLVWRTVPDFKYVEVVAGDAFPSSGLAADSALEKLRLLTAD